MQTHSIKMAERKAVIKNADMSEDMQQDAVDCATQVKSDFKTLAVPFVPLKHTCNYPSAC